MHVIVKAKCPHLTKHTFSFCFLASPFVVKMTISFGVHEVLV